MATFEFSELSYTLSNFLVASYDISAGTYGTPSGVASGQTVDVDPQADTDELRGYGSITRLLTVETHANLNVKAGGYDFDAFAIMTGANTTTSGITPNQVREMDWTSGGAGLPYFGIIGEAVTDDGGLVVIGLRCCKLDKRPQYVMSGEQNQFNMSEAAGKAIPVLVSSSRKLGRINAYETESDYTVPTDGTEFLAFFS